MKINALFFTVLLFLLSFSVNAEIVNLNKADAATFQHYLKGVGEKKAISIVAYRTENKEFRALEEIMEVKGIGEGIFKKIKANLSLTKGLITVPGADASKKSAPTTKPTTKENKDVPSTPAEKPTEDKKSK